VTELYDFLNKWDSFVDVVPDLVSVFYFTKGDLIRAITNLVSNSSHC